jgi:hypothetical protein
MAVTTRRSELRLPCTLVDVHPASESGLVKPRDRQRGSSRGGCGTLIAVKRAEAGEQEETEVVSGGRQKGTWTRRLEQVGAAVAGN